LSSTEEQALPAPGELVLSKYRVERVIGQGGMGVVLAVRHVDLGELFAMKVLRPSVKDKPGAAARFVKEARAAARLRSDHVARVYDVGTLDASSPIAGTPYLLMEFLEGLDLSSILAAHGPMPAGDVVDYVSQALDAIGEAHSLGLVHRDLKPGNLFLAAKPSGVATVKVLDFGISKDLDEESGSMTQSGDLIGSPFYMSPEQMRGSRDIDTRVDLWALGVIMFELLSDTVPFPGKTSTQVCSAVLEGPIPSIRALVPDVPEELAAAIAKCLRRNRDERFASAEELVGALARVPKTFDGSRSSRTKRLLGPPSSGRNAVAAISLTKSAITISRPPAAGAREERATTGRDRRADPSTPPRGLASKDPRAADETESPLDAEALAALSESARIAATAKGTRESAPDSLPRRSLPGVSEVPNGPAIDAEGTPRDKPRIALVATLVAVAAAAIAIFVVMGGGGQKTGGAGSASPPERSRIEPSPAPSMATPGHEARVDTATTAGAVPASAEPISEPIAPAPSGDPATSAQGKAFAAKPPLAPSSRPPTPAAAASQAPKGSDPHNPPPAASSPHEGIY
jgi:serine/threonine-protein kinase